MARTKRLRPPAPVPTRDECAQASVPIINDKNTVPLPLLLDLLCAKMSFATFCQALQVASVQMTHAKVPFCKKAAKSNFHLHSNPTLSVAFAAFCKRSGSTRASAVKTPLSAHMQLDEGKLCKPWSKPHPCTPCKAVDHCTLLPFGRAKDS